MTSTADLPNEASAISTTFTWRIDHFAELVQTRYDSAVFSTPDSTKFFLAIHPKGSNSFWSNSHTLIYLYLKASDREQLELQYKIALLNAAGEPCNSQEGKAIFVKQTKWLMMLNWQFNILRDYLTDPKNKLLENGTLSILCKVQILDKKYLQMEPTTISQVSDDLGVLLDEAKLSDVTLRIGNRELKAHRVILSARSPVFAAMFIHDTKEKQESQVDIVDVDYETVQQLISYIYTGRLPPMERFAESLLAAADKYQVDSLKQICEQYLTSCINIESAAACLLLADLHNATGLKSKCIEYIVAHPHPVMATDGWKVIGSSRPELGLQLFQRLASKTSHL